MVGGGGPLGPRLPLRPPGLGTFLCCCCGTAAAAGGGSRRTGRQDRDWEVGSVGLGPSRAAGSKGQRGSWLTVSPTQDEAAVPGGRALRRNPGRGSASAGPAQGERWARQGRTPCPGHGALSPVAALGLRAVSRPQDDSSSRLPDSLRASQTLRDPRCVPQTAPQPIQTRTLTPSPDARALGALPCPSALRPNPVPDPPPTSGAGDSPSPPALRGGRLQAPPRLLQGSQARASWGLSA